MIPSFTVNQITSHHLQENKSIKEGNPRSGSKKVSRQLNVIKDKKKASNSIKRLSKIKTTLYRPTLHILE